MRSAKGFTLVELLVVIAIISILAAIAVPQITRWISKAQLAKAVAEVESIELALNKMLTDSGRRDFSQMVDSATLSAMKADLDYSNKVMYELLRQGRNADAGLLPPVRKKLGTSYMEIPLDPWDNRYQFFPGPWNPADGPIQLRAYREGEGDRYDPAAYQPYRYNATRKFEEDNIIPGNPPPDGQFGFPAPIDMPFYVWSLGANLEDDQLWAAPETGFEGGGDDINNWDNQSGWSLFYN